MKLIIDRSKWLRGEGAEKSALLRPEDGKLCCLGFYAQVCGIEAEAMSGASTPTDVPDHDGMWGPSADWLFDHEYGDVSADCHRLMKCNDYFSIFDEINEEDRERDIAAIFAQYGVEVEFVG